MPATASTGTAGSLSVNTLSAAKADLAHLLRPSLQRHVCNEQQVRARRATRGLHGHALRYGHDKARECRSIGICGKIAFGLGALEALAQRLLSIGPALAQFLLDVSPSFSVRLTSRVRSTLCSLGRIAKMRLLRSSAS